MRYKIWVDDRPGTPEPPDSPLGAPRIDLRYQCPNDVPQPLRAILRQSYATGITPSQLALVFELPEQWVQLFVEDAGNA